MKFTPSFSLVILFVFSGCASMKTDAYSDSENDFSRYKTYAWIHRPKNHRLTDTLLKNEIVEREIIRLTNLELEARGLRADTLKPDILLDYSVKTKDTTEIRQESLLMGSRNLYYYNGLNYNPYYSMMPLGITSGYNLNQVPVTVGTITIYLIDREKNQLEWQGTAKGTITSARSFKKELPLNIKAMFRKYPVKVKNR